MNRITYYNPETNQTCEMGEDAASALLPLGFIPQEKPKVIIEVSEPEKNIQESDMLTEQITTKRKRNATNN